jgi:hypothetical protein
VSSGNHQRTTVTYKLFFHDLGLGTVEQFPVESCFQFRIAARNCIADDDAIWTVIKMSSTKTYIDRNAQGFEHGRHRGVYIFVRTGDAMSAGLKHSAQRSHGSAADPDQVIVHVLLVLFERVHSTQSFAGSTKFVGVDCLMRRLHANVGAVILVWTA